MNIPSLETITRVLEAANEVGPLPAWTRDAHGIEDVLRQIQQQEADAGRGADQEAVVSETRVIPHCTLEIDLRRGVIYVHSEKGGYTTLRICGLVKSAPVPAAVPGYLGMDQVDITVRQCFVSGSPVRSEGNG